MNLFTNRTINLVYVHSVLQAFLLHGGEAFAFVYLLQRGIPAPVVLLAIGGLYASRLLFRQVVIPLTLRFGLRRTLMGGIVLEGLTYFLLPMITGLGPLFFLHLFLLAISSSVYWTSYHAYLSQVGDTEHRGAQVSGLELMGTLAAIVAPVASGLLLTYVGPWAAFPLMGTMMVLAALPFAYTPEVAVARHATVPLATRQLAWRVMFGDGLRTAGFHYTWMIALFITLGQNFASYGGTLALAGLIGAAVGLFAGRSVDTGKGLAALQMGIGAITVAILLRAAGHGAVWSAVLANAAAALAWPAYATAQTSRLYDLAKQSPCSLRYHVVAEGGWDFGVATGCVLAAGMLALGFGFFWPILLSLAGSAIVYVALAPAYAGDAAPVPLPDR